VFVNAKTATGLGVCQSLFGKATLIPASFSPTWAVVDPILEAWKSGPEPTDVYPAGSWGPRAAEAFVEDEGRHWRRI